MAANNDDITTRILLDKASSFRNSFKYQQRKEYLAQSREIHARLSSEKKKKNKILEENKDILGLEASIIPASELMGGCNEKSFAEEKNKNIQANLQETFSRQGLPSFQAFESKMEEERKDQEERKEEEEEELDEIIEKLFVAQKGEENKKVFIF